MDGPILEDPREHQEPKKSREGFLDKDIEVKLNARKVVKTFGLLFAFALFFFAGQLTASSDFSVTGLVTGVEDLLAADEAVEEEPEVVEETKEEVEAAPPKVEEEPEPEVEEEPAQEKIVTKYEASEMQLKKVVVDWKETWGKVTKLDLAIINNEDGTIKPDHVLMVLVGYDFEKKIPLPSSLQSIPKGKGLQTLVTVPSGYPYSDQAIDIDAAKIVLTLRDAKGRTIDTLTTTENLNG